MNKNKQIKIDLIPGIKEIGLPVIEIEIGGNTHLFILDSGSTMSLVTCALKDSYPYSDIGLGSLMV